jgi:hypothetical protein
MVRAGLGAVPYLIRQERRCRLGRTGQALDLLLECRQDGDIPGTDLHRLLSALAPDPARAEQALQQLIDQAQAEAAAPPPTQQA